MDSFTRGYIEAMLWSSYDMSTEDEEGCVSGSLEDNGYTEDDLAPKFLEECIKDCQDFQEANSKPLQVAYTENYNYTEDHAGHDFWLTRNGHGAGFWDRGLGDVGEELSEAARVYGEVNPYVYEGKVCG